MNSKIRDISLEPIKDIGWTLQNKVITVDAKKKDHHLVKVEETNTPSDQAFISF